MSDGWKSYRDLPDYLPEIIFSHDWVNHRKAFVDKDDHQIHTQTIECFWKHFKHF